MNLLRVVVCFLSLGVITVDAALTAKPQTEALKQKKAGDLLLQPFVFQPRSGEKVDAEIGRLSVPENRKDPNTKLIELVFIRFKSTSASPGPPIIYLAGGPGGSGIATARGTRFPLFMAMREVGDVIAFDQRATGNSTPDLDCPQTLDYPLDRAGAREEFLRQLKQKSRECAEHWKSKGVDLAGYNTNESADDIESLRVALGAEKVSLWGISYGTHLALATIRRHEKRIHQAILAGVEGPAHSFKLPSNIQENLEKINRLVKADASLNKQIPDLIAMMKTVLERLEKQPLQLEATNPQTRERVKVTVGRFDLERLTASVVGNEAVAQIPAIYHALFNGNTSHPLISVLAGRVFAQRRGQLGSAMPFAMDCASGVSKNRRERILREARGSLLRDSIDFPFPDVCEGWGVPDLGEGFRSAVKSSVPALFISGTLDARTPVSNAEEVRKGFATSVHLIIDGAVHSDPLFLSSPRIKDVMLEFMKEKPISTTRITLPPMRFAPVSQ